MKKSYKNLILILILFLSLITLLGCETVETVVIQKNSRIQSEEVLDEYTNEGLIIKKINLDNLEDASIKDLLTEKDSKHGIYAFEIQGENKDLIYFNGLEHTFSNIEFSIENDTLIITSQISDSSEGTSNKTLLLLEKTQSSPIQSIKAKITELEPGTTTIYDF